MNLGFRTNMKFTEYLKTRTLLEFARRGEVVRSGILLDSEDIEFLEQFPPKFWIRAVYERYHNDLYNALKQRHDVRVEMRRSIVRLLEKALVSGDFSDLESRPDLFSAETIKQLSDKYDSDWRSDYRTFGRDRFKEAAKNAAEQEAYYLSERLQQDVPNPIGDSRTYEFKSRNTTTRITANPFINRLVHKLERTKGEPHSPDVGLAEDEHPVGMYGFDLDDPQKGDGKIPHSTRGMQLITYDMAKKAVGKLLRHNFHRYYGELPNPGDEVGGKKIVSWKPVSAEKGELPDNTIEEEKLSEIKRSLMPKIGNKFTSFRTNQISLILKDGTTVRKPANSTTVVFKEPGNIPPMKHAVKTSSEFDKFVEKIATKEFKWMLRHDPELSSMSGPPIPGHPQHESGTPISEKQIVHLPHFKKTLIVNGKEVTYELPFVRPASFFRMADDQDHESSRSGYRKSIVPIDHDDYVKTPGHGGAAMHPNQNKPREYALPFGVPGHLDLMSEIFGEMRKFGKDHPKYPDCYEDIIKGAERAINNMSRGVRQSERSAVENNIIEIHDIVLSWMKKNLSQEFMKTSEGRKEYAKNTVLRILQQDIHGGKTARRRALERAARAKPYKSLLTRQQREMVEKLPQMTDELAAYGRRMVSGTHAMPYGREGLSSIVQKIRAATEALDRDDPIKNMDHESITDEFKKLTTKKFTRRANLESAMRTLLLGIIHKETGRSGPDLESQAEAAMRQVRAARTISSMVANFQSLRVVQDFISPTPRTRLPARDVSAVSGFSALPQASNPRMRGATRTWESLLSQKDYMALIYNYEYMKRVKESTLLGLKSWLDKKLSDNTISAYDHSEASAEISEALEKRRATENV